MQSCYRYVSRDNEWSFQTNNPHSNVMHTSQFSVNPAHGAYNGTESAWYFGPKMWVQIPSEIRNKKFLVGFKREIKKWKSTDCPVVSLIIQFSWLLILHIHLHKKILPVSSISGQFDVQKRKAFGFQNTPLTFSSYMSFLLHEAVLST